MQIGFWHSNYGGSPMMVGLQRGLESLGHSVMTYCPGERYNLVILWNQIAHNPHYSYPQLPNSDCRFALVDGAEYGYHRRHPWIIREYANAFSPGSVTHDTKNAGQQAYLRAFLEDKAFPYFVREKSRFVEWPKGYYGVDYPLYLHSECHERPNREEYLARSVEFFQSWGMSHPWRNGITQALREAGYECLVLEEDTGSGPTPRMPQTEYFPRMRGSRASCSFDGYGSSSFRKTEVLCRTVLLQGPLTVDFPYPLVDRETCVEFNLESDGEEFISTDIVSKLEKVLADPEWSYGVYERGYDHCMTHLTEQALAKYVLQTIEGHDYSQVTPLDIPCQAMP